MQPKTTTKLTLEVGKRDVFGKKLGRLRQKGLIPGNIFGPDFKSQAITVAFKDFYNVYKIAKETGIIYLKLAAEEIPVLIKHLQFHPVSNQILHIDFRKVDLKKTVDTAVPVKLINQSPAVSKKGGVLLTLAETLNVHALPQDIPPAIEIDISVLTDIPQEIKVKDLKQSSHYEIKEEPEKVIVSVIAHKQESTVAETTTATTPEVISAKAEETPTTPNLTPNEPAKEEKNKN
jgi:large subunit ribosomal protein L25